MGSIPSGILDVLPLQQYVIEPSPPIALNPAIERVNARKAATDLFGDDRLDVFADSILPLAGLVQLRRLIDVDYRYLIIDNCGRDCRRNSRKINGWKRQ
jgi:hypothetical protein